MAVGGLVQALLQLLTWPPLPSAGRSRCLGGRRQRAAPVQARVTGEPQGDLRSESSALVNREVVLLLFQLVRSVRLEVQQIRRLRLWQLWQALPIPCLPWILREGLHPPARYHNQEAQESSDADAHEADLTPWRLLTF